MIKHFNIDFLRRSVIASNDPNDAPEGYLLPSSIACVFAKEGNAWLVFRQKEFTIDCLVHECIHITHVLMNIVGQKPSEANDEFEAYLCEYVFSNLISITPSKMHLDISWVSGWIACGWFYQVWRLRFGKPKGE